MKETGPKDVEDVGGVKSNPFFRLYKMGEYLLRSVEFLTELRERWLPTLCGATGLVGQNVS